MSECLRGRPNNFGLRGLLVLFLMFCGAFTIKNSYSDESNAIEDSNYALTIHECLGSMAHSLTKNVVGGVYFTKYCEKKPNSSRYIWSFQYKKKNYDSGWLGPKNEEDCAASLGSALNKEISGLEITIFSRCTQKQPIHQGLSAYTWTYKYVPVE